MFQIKIIRSTGSAIESDINDFLLRHKEKILDVVDIKFIKDNERVERAFIIYKTV